MYSSGEPAGTEKGAASLGAASACCANLGDPPTKVVSVRTAVITATRRASRNLKVGLELAVLCCFSNIGGSPGNVLIAMKQG